MGKRRPKPVSILTDAEWRPPLIETEGIAGKTIIMSNHNFYPNTELGIDLKLITRKPGRLGIGSFNIRKERTMAKIGIEVVMMLVIQLLHMVRLLNFI